MRNYLLVKNVMPERYFKIMVKERENKMAAIIEVVLKLIVFILLLTYSLIRRINREDDLAKQEKYMNDFIKKKEKKGKEEVA